MKNDKQTPYLGVPVAVLPMYGIVRFAFAARGKRYTSKHVIELPRGALGLTCDEMLAVLATAPVQQFLMSWRLNLVKMPVQEQLEALVRVEMGNLQQAISARQARLAAWEDQRECVQRSAAAVVEEMDRRALRGMASKLTHAPQGGMPAAVQIFKWGHDLAVKACEDRSHGFESHWDFELAAITFGDELEMELRYIDPSIGELLNPASLQALRDFESHRTPGKVVVEAA